MKADAAVQPEVKSADSGSGLVGVGIPNPGKEAL